MAKPFNKAPTRKKKPPTNIEVLRPIILVVVEAQKEAINAARYNEEVNKERFHGSHSSRDPKIITKE
ncbi:unnamed protein product [Sphenostylis stenocarpa]|uniref:Uncharacterized protein n=1 Tax=Sphenostylis stenocarpa TaxID=92480 RepID=A0AA86SAD9_9FABA|nr:unnamed protein product [Sphenostylis stenocarpa]CAJ1949527.1 unnamed protein product [Sphenostylis stenocarpa]